MARTMLVSIAGALALACAAATPASAVTGPFSGSYKASGLALDNLAGHVDISVGGSDITVAITGDADELATVTVGSDGSVLKIRSTRHNRHLHDAGDLASYKISVPKGTALMIDGMIGEIAAGDLGGDLSIDAGALKGTIGAVRSASLDASGALKLEIGDIAGDLSIDASGAARIKTGNVDNAHLDISGAGDIGVEAIRHGLSADINGAAHITALSVNGPVNIDASGESEVLIGSGRADPLKLDISGLGKFEFGGEAVNPEISVSGRSSVKLHSYTGKLHSDGSNITIGD